MNKIQYKITNPLEGILSSYNINFPTLENIYSSLDQKNYPIIEYSTKVETKKEIPSKKLIKKFNINISFEDLLKQIGANARITSGYRPNATTKQGRRSWHSYQGGAYDIVPLDGNFSRLREVLTTHPLSIAWFKANDKGILDETTPEMLAKTGGTGAHFHIGPDRAADRFWKAVERAKSGIKIKKENRGKFTEAAENTGMGVQEYANKILSNKDKYSSKLVKRANFAKNASKWKK